jgi:serine/threonine-protein kinase
VTQAEWQRVRELFERALEQRPADVTAWLACEAAGEPDVSAEVRSLLDYHERSGEFIVQPVSDRVPELLGDQGTLVPGQTVGSYTIIREAGRGGMGRVYLAHDTRLGRTVALKALSPELVGDPAGRERLRREARAAAALTHPGICTVYALEEFEGELFIATEFVNGHTLREEIASGRRPSSSHVLETAREIGAALASAHARNITHRDLKPENVMRRRDGQVKILDFGLARSDGPSTDPLAARVTMPATVIGTPAYMAPEQLKGDPADARSDVFAYGVLLYEYASGVHPFEAATPLATMARVLEGEPQPVEHRVPDLSHELVAVIARCLRKAPADRFASAGEIVPALTGVTDLNRPLISDTTAWWRIHQLVVIALYLVAAALAWEVKEWQQGITVAVFVAIGSAGAAGGVFRGHLVFTEQFNPGGLEEERRRAGPITMAVDLLVALGLAIDGSTLMPTHPVWAVMTMALAIGIALTRLVLEPATTAAAFPTNPVRRTART